MGDNGDSPTLFTKDDTSGEYVAYEPPSPPAFHDTLPEDLKASEHLEGVEDAAGLARYYVDLKSNYLAPPETAEGYEFEKPDGFMATDAEMASLRQMAFDNGYNQKQFAELMGFNVSNQKQAVETHTKLINDNHDETVAALKTEWGDNYEKNVESANRILNHEKVADEGFKQFLKDTRFGDNPQVIKYFEKLSRAISEDVFTKPGTGSEKPGPNVGEDGKPMLRFPSMEK